MAVALCRRACELAPDHPDCADALARTLHFDGATAEAIGVYDRFLDGHPDAIELRLARLLKTLPLVYDSPAHLQHQRGEYERYLGELEFHLDRASAATCERLLARGRSFYPMTLAYQGLNDAPLQRRFGGLIHRTIEMIHPTDPSAVPVADANSRPRIGFVSNQFRQHTIWQAITRPWLSGLARRGFDCFGYAPDHLLDDECTAWSRTDCVRFHTGERTFEEWVALIRQDRLHALIYPSLGYSKLVEMLALRRLAPVQCLTAGHWETSGFPTLDYFISGDLMEPEDGAAHYTEQLVRLPKLGVAFEALPVADSPLTREDFGLAAEDFLFISPHLPHKYLPWHDSIYARIAAGVANAKFLFFRHHRSEGVSQAFEWRLRRAFEDQAPGLGERLLFLERLPHQRYRNLLRLADSYLDVTGWNGGNTTAEAIALGLPVVTLEGDMARSRMGAAMLRLIGVPELIATDPDDYVRIALRLGQDPDWREGRRISVRQQGWLLSVDPVPIDGLASFLLGAIRGAH